MATNAVMVNPVLNSDDNLVNGRQYTFVFHCDNFLSCPDIQTLWNDLNNNAPNFLGSLNIVRESGANSSYYNVCFTYEGDGSDVVSDVGQSIATAIQTGSSDSFTYLVGFGANIPTYSVTSGGNTAGVSYQFSPLNLVEPVTPAQQTAYAAEAKAQVQAVGTSPGGQVASAVAPSTPTGNTFTDAVSVQATAAGRNVDAIAGQANTAAASSTFLILAAVAAAIVAFFVLAKPRVSVGAA
jgi:hypothetical protein